MCECDECMSGDAAEVVGQPVRVSLVRVEGEWHVFTDTQTAWRFYAEWREFRDCEAVLEVPVDVSAPESATSAPR